MLKIALVPDAAYELCTIFAPDCRNQTRRIPSPSSYSNSRNYGPVIHTTSSSYYEGSISAGTSSGFPGRVFPTSRSYYGANYDNGDLSRSGGRTHPVASGSNSFSNTQNGTFGRETPEYYEEGNEGNEESSLEENEDYNLLYRSTDATRVTNPTVGTYLQNQSSVIYFHILFHQLYY